MTTTQKRYYAFLGQNASTGTPHKVTGRMSFYGENFVFGTKKERDDFVEENDAVYTQDICVACSKRQLREYNLGMTVNAFNEDLNERYYYNNHR